MIVQIDLETIAIEKVSQTLCLLVNLFIPFEFKEQFSPVYEKSDQRLLHKL
jgi:hypothetical protein